MPWQWHKVSFKMKINTIFTKNDKITVREAAELAYGGKWVAMVLPLSFKIPKGQWWLFPIEPLISITGRNVIVKRNVSKSEKRGTIKERWAEDDFKITIEGKLEHEDLNTYPSNYLTELHEILKNKNAIRVKNELFALLGIHQIVVESYSFPFSKGENVQNFIIEAYSDDLYELFIDVKNV